jgi:Mn-dependent DtxR family transcriptional regulator
MVELSAISAEIRQFILDNIDSVAQLEALLLLRSGSGRTWNVSTVARHLYIQQTAAAEALRVLHERDLIVLADPGGVAYEYGPKTPERVRLVEDLATVYARQLVAVTRLIHAKAAGDAQGFSRAFRLRKDE